MVSEFNEKKYDTLSELFVNNTWHKKVLQCHCDVKSKNGITVNKKTSDNRKNILPLHGMN